MNTASVLGDATKLACSGIDNMKTGTGINSARIIDDNGSRRMENKVAIVTRKKQINANGDIYHVIKQDQNSNNIQQNHQKIYTSKLLA